MRCIHAVSGLTEGGKRAGNAHDRRRNPPLSETRDLARRWRRHATDRRRHLLRFESYNTWTAHLYGRVDRIEYEIDGCGQFSHDITATDPHSLYAAIQYDIENKIPRFGRLTRTPNNLTWTAHSYGVHMVAHNTANLVWCEVVGASSGEADRMPAFFKVTGRGVKG